MITVRYPSTEIAVFELNDPNKGANVLSRPVLDELELCLGQLEKRRGLKGLIFLSSKPGSFIAGADLREFAASLDSPREQVVAMAEHGRKLFERLTRLPLVSVAAIDGVCLGGGAELALWCDRRIMASEPSAQFGLPEVKLGLFPGWGGTVRAPRIVGLANAVEMITSGESVDAQTAAAMGLVSDVVPKAGLEEAAIALVRAEQESGEWLADRKRWSGPIEMSETELTFLGATASAVIQGQTFGNYPAPLAALEVLLGAACTDSAAAGKMESEGMAELWATPVNRALLNVFFLTDRNKKDPGVDRPIEPRPVRSVAVTGTGIMGVGIAAANVKRDVPVTITDASPEAMSRAVQQILEEVSYNKELRGPDVQRSVRLAPLINATQADTEIVACDLVIEAVVENPEVKRSIFDRLEPQLAEKAMLASNTSTIPISRLASGMKHPERFCGIHFFNPVRKMALVEVIRGEKTSDETIATAVAYAKRIGKSPIVVGDAPGFLVNRLLLPYMNESLELLAEGAEMEAIERAAKKFGMPMGPLTLYDVVGLDTAFYAGRVMWEAFPDRIHTSPILPALIKAKRLGQKSGAGFYSYDGDKLRGKVDPALAKLIARHIGPPRKFTQEELTARLFLPMVLEATRILEDKVARDVRDIDLALIFGIGFPAFRGGLLFWADSLGAARIVEMLKPLEPLGERMHPTPLLLEMARTGARFYDAAPVAATARRAAEAALAAPAGGAR